MKRILLFILALLTLACQRPTGSQNEVAVTNSLGSTLHEVTASGQTEPVSADPNDDAADDPAIWRNESNPENSLILGSNKTLGLDVFRLDGSRVMTDTVGRINNVDVRNGFSYNGTSIALAGGSNRDNIGMDFWSIDPDSMSISYLTPGSVSSDLPDVYGFCMYKSPLDSQVYAFVNSKTGRVEQWKLDAPESTITATKVRELQLPSQVEGMVADDSLGLIYVGVENEGIYRFGAEPSDPAKGEILTMSGADNEAIAFDIEGLTLYYLDQTRGYLLASSQGNNTYAVFERSENNAYLGSFKIVDGELDGTEETDGIDVTSASFGALYPHGFFVVQDGKNRPNGTPSAQNFKMVRWDDIAQSFDPPLEVR